MKLEDFDLVASLQALPETDPVEIEGIQLGKGHKKGGHGGGGGGGNRTCQAQCVAVTVNVIQTVCAVAATC